MKYHCMNEINKAQQLILTIGICLASIGLGLITCETEWVHKLGMWLLTGSPVFMLIGCTVAE